MSLPRRYAITAEDLDALTAAIARLRDIVGALRTERLTELRTQAGE
ncbi:hypothetical protein [Allosphingosinicella humi]